MENSANTTMEPDNPADENSFLMDSARLENDYSDHYRAAKALIYRTHNLYRITPWSSDYGADLMVNPRLAAATCFKTAIHALFYHVDHYLPTPVRKMVSAKRDALRRQHMELEDENPEQYFDSEFAATASAMTGPLQVLFRALDDHYSQQISDP